MNTKIFNQVLKETYEKNCQFHGRFELTEGDTTFADLSDAISFHSPNREGKDIGWSWYMEALEDILAEFAKLSKEQQQQFLDSDCWVQ